MIIGVPKEIKEAENRVSITPFCVKEYISHGHRVLIESNAGLGSKLTDQDFRESGARIVDSAGEVWERADMIIKVKEPIEAEFSHMRAGQIIFTFFHLAAEYKLMLALMEKKVTAIAYETVQLKDGSLPILKPMSEIAGKLAIQYGAQALEAVHGGRGVLLGGASQVDPAFVVVLGGGTAGWHACSVALGMGARVCLLDIKADVLTKARKTFKKRFQALPSEKGVIERMALEADLLVGTILIPGARAPRLVSREVIKKMRAGSAIVDVSVDQGGCIETSHPTTHLHPFFNELGVIHCCITNFPGVVPLTSTYALANASLTFGLELADKGVSRAVKDNPALAKGLNTFKGQLVCPQVADAFGMKCDPL